jgi:hypothetical protein
MCDLFLKFLQFVTLDGWMGAVTRRDSFSTDPIKALDSKFKSSSGSGWHKIFMMLPFLTMEFMIIALARGILSAHVIW